MKWGKQSSRKRRRSRDSWNWRNPLGRAPKEKEWLRDLHDTIDAKGVIAQYIDPADPLGRKLTIEEGTLTNNGLGELTGTHKGVDLPSGSLVFMYGRFVGVIK